MKAVLKQENLKDMEYLKHQMVRSTHLLLTYRYEGNWMNNKLHGQGIEKKKDTYDYYGSFEEGKKHGIGKIVFNDGSRYEVRYFTYLLGRIL